MSLHEIVIPILPADEIRDAADRCDWTRAAALIAGHDHAVRAAWIDPPREGLEDAAWRELLAQQDALLLELRQRREAAAEAMARRQHDRRAAHRYLSQAAVVEE